MACPATKKIIFYSVVIGFLIFFPVMNPIASAHGGKKHVEKEFSTLDVLKKGTNLFDSLLKKKKIDTAWETHLEKVTISTVKTKSGEEFRISFTRDTGSPKTLFLFFNKSGEYQGSSFKKN